MQESFELSWMEGYVTTRIVSAAKWMPFNVIKQNKQIEDSGIIKNMS